MQLIHYDIQNKKLAFNSTQDGFFGDCLQIAGGKSPLPKLTHILQ